MMLRGAERWLPGVLRSCLRRRRTRHQHVLLCVADHFEPFGKCICPDGRAEGGRSVQDARQAVASWCSSFKDACRDACDSDGRQPRHTFFYPWDEYDPGCLDLLREFCAEGWGELEVHLHHRNDTAASLRRRLMDCKRTYAEKHGFLGRCPQKGIPRFAFVHGNWALCNARPDGDWCGVDAEIEVLRETGCYADFTFPSAPSRTQPSFVNAVYYGGDPREGERGHRLLKWCAAGDVVDEEHQGLLFIPGPLGLNWSSRKGGILPRLENGELSVANPATLIRMKHWMRIQVQVLGCPEWIIVKLHTHGMGERSRDAICGPAMTRFYDALRLDAQLRDSPYSLHFVTARELTNVVMAAMKGHRGDPRPFFDDGIAPPPLAG